MGNIRPIRDRSIIDGPVTLVPLRKLTVEVSPRFTRTDLFLLLLGACLALIAAGIVAVMQNWGAL